MEAGAQLPSCLSNVWGSRWSSTATVSSKFKRCIQPIMDGHVPTMDNVPQGSIVLFQMSPWLHVKWAHLSNVSHLQIGRFKVDAFACIWDLAFLHHSKQLSLKLPMSRALNHVQVMCWCLDSQWSIDYRWPTAFTTVDGSVKNENDEILNCNFFLSILLSVNIASPRPRKNKKTTCLSTLMMCTLPPAMSKTRKFFVWFKVHWDTMQSQMRNQCAQMHQLWIYLMSWDMSQTYNGCIHWPSHMIHWTTSRPSYVPDIW